MSASNDFLKRFGTPNYTNNSPEKNAETGVRIKNFPDIRKPGHIV
jgi:hypothetical protein